MSFLSRLFRKAPSLSPLSPSAPQPALPKPSAADRALVTAAEEAALQSAIHAGDLQAVARLVVEGTSTKVRQTAAQAIEDPEMLRQLIREVRGGNDKSVYKVLTAKRDLLLEKARKHEQLQAEINAASAALERHSQSTYDDIYSPTLTQFESRWEAVAAEADPALRSNVQQWIDRARETLAEHARQVAAEASLVVAAANVAAERLRLREQQALAAAEAATEQAQLVAEQTQALAEKQQAEQKAVAQMSGLIKKARDALRDGSTTRAAGLRRTIEQTLAGAPPLSAALASQIQQLDEQLAALKDWKSFSVTPKRAELIEEMELLVIATLDPLALAERIKSLQDEWRTLNKGAGESLEADALRFQAASQKAYQPCSEYFAAQALVRAENLRQRDTLVAQLTALEAEHDGQQPDWRTVIKALSDTKQAWYRYSPVDRQAGKSQQERFEALRASLQGRLDAEYARNQQQKVLLIEQARQLLESDDARKAIDTVKALQQQWRVVGPVSREVDQRLWSAFREHCDAVFQKRQQESASYAASLDHNKAQAIVLCEQLEEVAALEGAALQERTSALAGWRRAFEALGEFPRADTRELRSRFEKGLQDCEAAIARQQVRDAEQSWSDLFEAANQVRAYRLAVVRSVDAAQLDRLKAAAETCIAAVRQWPNGGLDRLKHGLADAGSADVVANEAALKMLCIRAEILTDLPTPPEDQPLRREYQLKRLVQRMGQGVRPDEMQLNAMAIEWVGVGPVEEAAYQPLLQRFRRLRERGHSRPA